MFRNEIEENNSDRLKGFNQGHNRQGVKVLTLDDFNLKGKTVFLRVDMNCPIDPKTLEISGTRRIEEAIETLQSLKEAKVVPYRKKIPMPPSDAQACAAAARTEQPGLVGEFKPPGNYSSEKL